MNFWVANDRRIPVYLYTPNMANNKKNIFLILNLHTKQLVLRENSVSYFL